MTTHMLEMKIKFYYITIRITSIMDMDLICELIDVGDIEDLGVL